MKRFIAAVCMLAMLATGIGATGEDLTAALTEVTVSVKTALDIGDGYDDFTSNFYSGNWELSWRGEDSWVNVICDVDGKILSYYYYDNTAYSPGGSDYDPGYPRCTGDQLKALVDEFLGNVITGENEGWVLNEYEPELLRSPYQRYYMSGRLTFCGVPSDIELNVYVDPNTLEVTDYSRRDAHIGNVRYPEALSVGLDAAAALDKLAATVDMELVYYNTDPADMARLVYMPKDSARYVAPVDGGDVLNVSALYSEAGSYRANAMGVAGDSAASETYMEKLTEAELEGISIYDGAMSGEELDAKLRSMAELGITEEYIHDNTDYFRSDDELHVTVSYRRPLTDADKTQRGYDGYEHDIYDYKTITMNAADSSLLSVYSYYDGTRGEDVEIDEAALSEKAAGFMAAYFPEYSVLPGEITVNASEYSWARSVTCEFVRAHNGHPFREDSFRVTVNAMTGAIDELYYDWDDQQEFYEPDEALLIGEDAAKQAYIAALPVEEVFALLPEGKSDAGEANYSLEHCWEFSNAQGVYAVDAVTGETCAANRNPNGIEYSDLDGAPYSEIAKKLAAHGIGFMGSEFNGLADFTLYDALTLILQAGLNIDVSISSIDEMIERAVALGAPDMSGISLDRAITRAEFSRILVTMLGYGRAAEIDGIYACNFADDADVAADDYGYIAIAYGLGLIVADRDGNINASEPLTRAEGATIFHRLLLDE